MEGIKSESTAVVTIIHFFLVAQRAKQKGKEWNKQIPRNGKCYDTKPFFLQGDQ